MARTPLRQSEPMRREYQVYSRPFSNGKILDYAWSEPVNSVGAVEAVKHFILSEDWAKNQIRIVKVVATGELIEVYV